MMTFWQAVLYGFSHPWIPLRQLFCKHRMYIEAIRRVSENVVTGQCHKCDKVFVASYGLLFIQDGIVLEQRPQASAIKK